MESKESVRIEHIEENGIKKTIYHYDTGKCRIVYGEEKKQSHWMPSVKVMQYRASDGSRLERPMSSNHMNDIRKRKHSKES